MGCLQNLGILFNALVRASLGCRYTIPQSLLNEFNNLRIRSAVACEGFRNSVEACAVLPASSRPWQARGDAVPDKGAAAMPRHLAIRFAGQSGQGG
jgi:hypothetical protein